MSHLVIGVKAGISLLSRAKGFSLAIVLVAGTGLLVNAFGLAIVDSISGRAQIFYKIDELVYMSLSPSGALRAMSRDRASLINLMSEVVDSDQVTSVAFTGVLSSADPIMELTQRDTFTRPIRTAQASPGFATTLGVVPVLGRDLNEEDASSKVPGALVTSRVWKDQFAADPGIIGRTVSLPNATLQQSVTIVGVIPTEMTLPCECGLWVAKRMPTTPIGGGIVARLAPKGDLNRLKELFPELLVEPLRSRIRAPTSGFLIYGAVSCAAVFLMAFLQVGMLYASRMHRKAREWKIRLALGTTPRQLRTQLFGEVLVLLAIAGTLSAGLVPPTERLLVAYTPTSVGLGSDGLSMTAVQAVCSLAAVGLLLTWCVPAALLGAIISPSKPETGWRWHDVAAVGQLALLSSSIYVVVLCVDHYKDLSSIDIGFDMAGIWTQPLPRREIPRGLTRAELQARESHQLSLITTAIDRVARIRGVEAVAAGEWPLGGNILTPALIKRVGADYMDAHMIRVSSDFFRVLGLRITVGDEWIPTIVDETRARAARPVLHAGLGSYRLPEPPEKVFISAFPLNANEQLVGETIQVANRGLATIVGIAPSLLLLGPKVDRLPAVWSFSSHGDANNLILRLSDETAAVRSEVRRTIEDTWSGAAVPDPVPVTRWRDSLLQDELAAATVLSVLVVFSLPVTIIGLMGWTSQWLESERRTAVIRVALGASASVVRRGLLARFIPVVLCGLILGGFLTWSLSGFISSMRLEAPGLDAKALIFVLCATLAVALISAIRPLFVLSRVNLSADLRAL